MELSEYKNIFENEEFHFFYCANHNIILSLVKRYLRPKPNTRYVILDAGCGTGLLTKKLEVFGNVLGVDISDEAIKFSRKRGVKVKKGSINRLPFPPSMFDAVVSIDVLYHKSIRNDKQAFSEFLRVLKPGGILVMRVPANKWLRLTHDVHVHTRERYDKTELERKLLESGFSIAFHLGSLNLPLQNYLHWSTVRYSF